MFCLYSEERKFSPEYTLNNSLMRSDSKNSKVRKNQVWKFKYALQTDV